MLNNHWKISNHDVNTNNFDVENVPTYSFEYHMATTLFVILPFGDLVMECIAKF